MDQSFIVTDQSPTLDDLETAADGGLDDEFLLREGLDVLADYRDIRDDTVRAAVRTLIASLCGRTHHTA